MLAPWLQPSMLLAGLDLRLVAIGAAAVAALRRVGRSVDLNPEPELRQILEARSLWPVSHPWRALVNAELSGPTGDGYDPVAWHAAVTAADLDRIGAEYRVYTRMRLAEALLQHNERDAATDHLIEAKQLANQFGTTRLLREMQELAHRSGLMPHHSASAGENPGHLTVRELQVLELVADGLSNSQIGQRLFISTKTASVHVSAILRKLGVTNRTEAASRFRPRERS